MFLRQCGGNTLSCPFCLRLLILISISYNLREHGLLAEMFYALKCLHLGALRKLPWSPAAKAPLCSVIKPVMCRSHSSEAALGYWLLVEILEWEFLDFEECIDMSAWSNLAYINIIDRQLLWLRWTTSLVLIKQ